MTGLYPNMVRAEYESIDAVNLSTLKLLGKAPMFYKYALEHGRPDSTALRLGRAVHVAVFEPDDFDSRYAVWKGTRRGNAWDEYEATEQREILNATEFEQALAISSAIRKQARDYIRGGLPEVSALWRHGDTPCKGRFDYIKADALIDLKTTRDASPAAFERQSWNLGYHVQAAWYVDAVKAADGRDLPFVIIAAEKEPPYAVQVYEVPDYVIRMGRETYRDWLETLRRCKAANDWPGYASGPMQLGVPSWVGGDDMDLSELGLEVG